LEVAPRDPACTASQIDLSKFYNAALTDSWFDSKPPSNDLSALPAGLVRFGETLFDVRGVLQLAGSRPEMTISRPSQISGIEIHARCHALHFLQGTGWDAPIGTSVGTYQVRYADGEVQTIPIRYGENIANYWCLHQAYPALRNDTTVVWKGANARSDRDGCDLYLYKYRWPNPRPEAEIVSIDFDSTVTQAAPFLIAISAE
jgi:hypothetical protein